MSGVERGQRIVDIVRPYVHLPNSQSLDAGCGFGGACIALALAGSRVMGIDNLHQRLRGAAIRAEQDYQIQTVSFQQAILENLPFSDRSFDIVVCADVIEHVNSHADSVDEISRVLRPGGVAYLTFPNYWSPQNIREDPHYGLFGISILPAWLARFYVTRVRKKSTNYEVGIFPVASALRRLFRRYAMEVIWQNPILHRSLGLLTKPARAFLTNTYPIVEWVVKKS